MGLSRQPGSPLLSAKYLEGTTRVNRTASTHAIGAAWIHANADGDQQLAGGLAYVNTTSRGSLEVTAINGYDGTIEPLRRAAIRASASGIAVLAGYFFRPVPDGSLGVNMRFTGPLHGRVWTQEDGTALVAVDTTLPAQLAAGVGGSFKMLPQLLGVVDLKFTGGTTQAGVVTAEPAFSIRAGAEWTLRLTGGDLPLRAGFFTRPDALPATAVTTNPTSVDGMDLSPPFRQDLLGFTAGSGWARGGLRADLALVWLLANTHVKTRDAGGTVIDSGDVRNAFGVVGSVSLSLGRRTAAAQAEK